MSTTKLTLVLAVAFAAVLGAAYLGTPAHATSPPGALVPAAGNATEQWAFGGTAGGSYSCTNITTCFGPDSGENGTVSLSFRYYVAWVVIYTQTNVSASQTMVEGLVALNATASISFSECIDNFTGQCSPTSISLSVAGKESAVGFTNLTTGSVNLTSSLASPLGSTPALAIENAASQESFNFSGNVAETLSTGTSGSQTDSANFDLGANEATSIDFTTPLGVVPLNPSPGDAWNASAPYTASGTWTSGYSISVSGLGATSGTESNWTSGAAAPAGTLWLDGQDLGAVQLYDNYTTPPTQVTAQEIVLDFGTGAFAASDGWLMVPTGVYDGAGGILNLGSASGPLAPAVHADQGIGALGSGESAYYRAGVGFIGASGGTNTSVLGGVTGVGSTPSLSVSAGPEPVSVAQQQYNGITSSSGGSSGGVPFALILVAVVVVVVVIVGIVLMMRRGKPKGTTAPAPGAPGASGPTPPPPGQ